ncbi:MAG: sulfite exporter TauE/SafE family protein [Firmicutes bacterium]|nr:sulfite exporter TauE/SafE family protein [Bacillota bacterium]
MSFPMQCLSVFTPAILGGIIQSTTGFGFGIFVMMFFPMFLLIPKASALSSLISILQSFTMFMKYRKSADLKLCLVPAVFYVASATFCINSVSGMDMTKLKAVFGLFLIVIAIYFIFFSDKLKIKANLVSAMICGTVSGIASGLFGIGGPPMVIYMLAATDSDKEKYLGTLQLFFVLTNIYNNALRFINGIITTDILMLVIPGVCGMLIGAAAGSKIIDRINVATMKKLIYLFLAVSGAITFFSNI